MKATDKLEKSNNRETRGVDYSKILEQPTYVDEDDTIKFNELIGFIQQNEENLFYFHYEENFLNMKDSNGRTLLHYAAAYDREMILRILLFDGFNLGTIVDNLGVVDNEGDTPLSLAISKGQTNAAKVLVFFGADIIERTIDSITSLLLATYLGNKALVQWLIEEKGFSLDEKTSDGDTLLHIAAREGHEELLEWLWQKGGSLSETNDDGESVYALASNEFLELLNVRLDTEMSMEILKVHEHYAHARENLIARIAAIDGKEQETLEEQDEQWPSPLPEQKIIDTALECNNLIETLNSQSTSTQTMKPPECFVEAKIIEVWSHILKVEMISMTTSFNQLLNATQNKWHSGIIKLAYYFQINLDGIIDNVNGKILANEIKHKLDDAKIVRWLHKAKNKKPETSKALFFIHPVMGDDSVFRSLKEKFSNAELNNLECSAYTLVSPLLKFDATPNNFDEYCTLEYQARLAINAMRAVHPQGAYYLCGYSYGGALTLEIARQLLNAGKEVRYLGFIDPQLPQQFQNLTADELEKRLAQHLDYISCTLLGLKTDKSLFINAKDMKTKSKEKSVIIACAIDYATNKLNTDFKEHDNFQKLTNIYRTVKANYLAMGAYTGNQSIRSDFMPQTNVYVASDRADNLLFGEYFSGDLKHFFQNAITETVLPNSNHYSIIFEDVLARHIINDIKQAEEVSFSHHARRLLIQHYQDQAFSQIKLPFGENKLAVAECQFQIILEQLTDNENRHALVTGEMGLGKSVLARQLILVWMNANSGIWTDKHYVFYLPLQEICGKTYLHDVDLIAEVLHQQFYAAQGVSLAQVTMLWEKMKNNPARITFILDDMDEVINETTHQLLLQTFFRQASQVLVFSRDYQINALRKLGFSPGCSCTLRPFDQEDVDKFSEKFLGRQSHRFLDWLRSRYAAITASLTQKPLYLTLLASFWHEFIVDDAEFQFDLPQIIPDIIKRTLRRYLEHENIKDLVLDVLPEENLKEITQDILRFLRLTAYSMIRDDLNIISPYRMNELLLEHNAAPTLFQQVLLSGFLCFRSHAYYEADRSFAFSNDIFQLYFACEYAKSLAVIDPLFITELLSQYDVELMKLWLLEHLPTEQLQELIKLPRTNYDINNIRFYCYLFELIKKKTNEKQTIELPENIARLLCGLLIAEYAKAYPSNETVGKTDQDSQRLMNYRREITTLKEKCPRLMDYVKQKYKAYRLTYVDGEGLFEYALRQKDLELTTWCLEMGVDVQTTDKRVHALEIVMELGFSEGLMALENHLYQHLLLEDYAAQTNKDALSFDGFEAEHQQNIRKQLRDENVFINERSQVADWIILQWQDNKLANDFDSNIEKQLNNCDSTRNDSARKVKEYVDLFENLAAVENALSNNVAIRNQLLTHKLTSEPALYSKELFQAFSEMPEDDAVRQEINDAICNKLKTPGKNVLNTKHLQQALCEVIREKAATNPEALIPLVAKIENGKRLLGQLLNEQPSMALRYLLVQHKTRKFDRKKDVEVIKEINNFLIRHYKIQFKEAYENVLVKKVIASSLMSAGKVKDKTTIKTVSSVRCTAAVFPMSPRSVAAGEHYSDVEKKDRSTAFRKKK